MIGRLQGQLIEKNPPQVLIDCAGVGYEVDVPMSTFYQLPEIGATVQLLTHFVVREDAQLLYGFFTTQERQTFRQLIKVSGVGPKLALTILSGLSVAELLQSIADQDVARMIKVPGIGKKTAERLLLELKNNLKVVVNPANVVANQTHDDVLQALLSLGYNAKEAAAGVKVLPLDVTVGEGIKLALKALS